MPTLSIIIVTYNSSKYISPCLSSIRKYYEKDLVEGVLEVIVFDNNSQDDTVKIIKKEREKFTNKAQKNVITIENKENVGFANGVNRASKHATSEFLLLLNPDAEFENGNLFQALSYLQHAPGAAVLGAKILDSHGDPEPSSGKIYTFFPLLSMLTGTEEFFQLRTSPDHITTTGFVSGGCMMLSAKIFKEMGGFDKNLFMYMEDMEYCLRLQKKGFKVVFYPELVVSHASHGSAGKPYAIASIYKGVSYMYKKHMKNLSKLADLLLKLKAHILVFIGRISNNEYLVTAYEKALIEISA